MQCPGGEKYLHTPKIRVRRARAEGWDETRVAGKPGARSGRGLQRCCLQTSPRARGKPGSFTAPTEIFIGRNSIARILMGRGLHVCALSWAPCCMQGAEVRLFCVVSVANNFRGSRAFLALLGPHPAGLGRTPARARRQREGRGEAASHMSPWGCSCRLPALGFTRLQLSLTQAEFFPSQALALHKLFHLPASSCDLFLTKS